MTHRPHVLLSVATSIDGHIDDAAPERLLLSNPADLDRVDEVRAGVDAILIGAETIRRDNPRLLVNSALRRRQRRDRGEPDYPLKVTITASGDLDPALQFWHHGDRKLAYTTDTGAALLRERLRALTTVDVVSLGPTIDFAALLDDLGARGIRRLMVEGGQQVHTGLLAAGLVDEIHLAIAPLLVGHADAPRFLGPADYPTGPTGRMRLAGTETIGDVVLLRYLPKQESTA
ncbi:RibD family protein [Actinokineospora diospyrosa]|uniref:Riboflavin-specific deaminase C-terminal domain-containing protein n=1 Tax=Actinokineospora diospyrosa TaxID=103728 RepID=A0ABT1IKG0_9PSEU|nr:dihydrofolate reductase family protein [Actinokineospora diospyrosa]MCP2272701.1 riboflavin-specific deaminase C-terminal domain-containing protein [Actinokineospora diospyrosa]